ncbi:MAG: amidohydrolase [Candidatus Obscuribacterales bacterium]|jgi:predicted amidohydrolase YtcJ|nr:amidohydrolase [Candidatus Obscuribacterales bacterium]
MKSAFLIMLSAFFVLTGSSCFAADQSHADILMVNGSIYTMDPGRRWAQALAISNGRIVFVGTDQEATKFAGSLTKVVNLSGKMVLPGFIDSHIHPVQGALEEQACYLGDFEKADSIEKAITEYAQAHKSEEWVIGSGWSLPIYGPSGPKKGELDKLVPDRPAFFISQDGHSAWVNSKALEKAGINSFSPDPPNGRIEREADGRTPSGTLREGAVDVVSKIAPKPTEDQERQAALDVQKKLNKLGILAVQDASVGESTLKTYAALDDANLLTMRVSACMTLDPEKGAKQIDTFKEWRDKYDGDLLSARAVKIFSDGVVEAKTAAMLEPYSGGDAKDTGILNYTPAQLKWFATKLDAAGFQIHTHAIGDRAVRCALDAIETAQKVNGKTNKMHHIAHLEIIHPDDIQRFRRLNVVANFQPFWAYSDKYVTDLTVPILGEARMKQLYPINSLFRSGAFVVAGSDWTVTTANPLEAIQVAVTRCGLKETADKAFIPEERVSLPDILAAYTINGAYLGHWEKEMGSLEIGKSADVIVLDKNLFEISPFEIYKTKVIWTLFRGREVYRDPEFP